MAHDGTAFTYSVPAELAARIGAHRLHAPAVKGETTLTGVSCDGSLVAITATVIALDCGTASSETSLRLRHRPTGAELDVPTEIVREVALPSGTGHEVRAHSDLASCTSGVWDAYMVQHFGAEEIVNRLGAKKADGLRSDSLYLVAPDERARPLGKVYYTRGPENLSIDIGFTHTRNELPEASVKGTVRLSDGSELAIVSALPVGEITFGESGGRGGSSGRASIPFFPLDEGLFAVALPREPSRDGTRRCLVVRSGSAEQSLLLPAPAEAGVEDPWGSRAERRHGQRTADIFREAMGDLGVVGRRSARRAESEVKKLPRLMRGRPGRRRS